MAAGRDRAEVYDDYLVCDMTDLSDDERMTLEDHDFNALVTVAAIGFDVRADGLLDSHAERRYRHRLAVTGEELHYVGLVATKRGDVSAEWLEAAMSAS